MDPPGDVGCLLLAEQEISFDTGIWCAPWLLLLAPLSASHTPGLSGLYTERKACQKVEFLQAVGAIFNR